MPGSVATGLSSYRRQSLLTEFASLKHVQPQGIYVSLTPGDPSLWSGVLFVRDGPYAPAILRFRIFFPTAYPYSPPLVTFNADVFHPLLFDATRSSQNVGDAQGNVVERLPAGALSLQAGFPCWRTKRTVPEERASTATDPTLPQNKQDGEALDKSARGKTDNFSDSDDVYVVDILRYMRAVFEDAGLIDAVPFEEAANQSAWYAWRASKFSLHQKGTTTPSGVRTTSSKDAASDEAATQQSQDGQPSTPARPAHSSAVMRDATSKLTPKKPSEWKWDGVWEMRARKGIEASVTEAALFGTTGLRDDEIHFISVDAEDVDEMRAELHSCVRAG